MSSCINMPSCSDMSGCNSVNRKLLTNGVRPQVRLEVRHRGPLNLAVCLEAHPLNETAHAQIATWTPDADKAAIEVEGARIARQLQVPLRRCARPATGWVTSNARQCSRGLLLCRGSREEVSASRHATQGLRLRARRVQAPAIFGAGLGGMGLADGSGNEPEQVHLEDFKFAELKWAKSSRMSKRWLVFTCRIQARAAARSLLCLLG